MTVIVSAYLKHMYVTPVTDSSTNGIATSQHTTASTPMTLNGSLVSNGSYSAADGSNVNVGHLIGVFSSANVASNTFTIVGTDPDGLALSETISGINNSTVYTTNYFYTVTSVTPNITDGTNNYTVGIGSTLATQRVPIQAKVSDWAVGMGCTITGTISVSAQLTMDDIYDPTKTPKYIADTTFATKTATFYSQLGVIVTAIRFITNSYSSGATVAFHVVQNKE